jgi:cell division protein FtsX
MSTNRTIIEVLHVIGARRNFVPAFSAISSFSA